jgi:DTW domain-containing protein
VTARSLRARGRGYRTDRCVGCGLVPEGCACELLPRIDNRTRVTLVVHYRELQKPSNTGRIAERMLNNSRLLVRGSPEAEDGVDVERVLEEIDPARAVLLFPLAGARPLEEVLERDGAPSEIVVPDGTWSQTRRIVRRHPSLQRLRAVSVAAPTNYLLRRGVVPGFCCTVEAISAALRALDGAAVAEPLDQGFERWQRAALTVRGRLCLVQDTPAVLEEV